MLQILAKLIGDVAYYDKRCREKLDGQKEAPQNDRLWDFLHSCASKNRTWTEMPVRVICNASTDPTPIFVASVAGHMVATFDFIDLNFAVWALRHPWVDVVHEKPSLSRHLTCRFMHCITALPACLEATLADSPSLTRASRSSYRVFTVGSRAPLELVGLTNAHIFMDHVVGFLDLAGTELLDLLHRVLFFAVLLHAGKLHGQAVCDLCAQVVCLAVNAERMGTFEAEEVLFVIHAVADLTQCATLVIVGKRLSASVYKVFIKLLHKKRLFLAVFSHLHDVIVSRLFVTFTFLVISFRVIVCILLI